MRGGDHSDPGVQLAARNVTEEKLFLKFSSELFEISHNFYSTRRATATSNSLSNTSTAR